MATYAPKYGITGYIGPGPSLAPPAYGAAPLQAQGILDTSAVQNYPLGLRAKAVDPVLGEVEFIYAKGLAATAAGDVVTVNGDFATTRLVNAGVIGPVAVAMSACLAGQYGWYAVTGQVLANITANCAGNAANATATAGKISDTVVLGQQISGAVIATGLLAGGSAIVNSLDTTPAGQAVVRLNGASYIKAL
jgi:hypothetical protein